MATEVTIFSTPQSGGLYGVAIETMLVKGKSKRIAHADLINTGPLPHVTLSIPSKLSVEEVKELNSLLTAFIEEIERLHKENHVGGASDVSL